MTLKQQIGNIIAIGLGVLWTVASQAHFTGKLTLDMHAGINKNTKTLHHAFAFTGLTSDQVEPIPRASPITFSRLTREAQVKHGFGALGLLTAYLLFKRSTRTLGLLMAIAVTMLGRLYPQMMNNTLGEGDPVALIALLLVAAVALGLRM